MQYYPLYHRSRYWDFSIVNVANLCAAKFQIFQLSLTIDQVTLIITIKLIIYQSSKLIVRYLNGTDLLILLSFPFLRVVLWGGFHVSEILLHNLIINYFWWPTSTHLVRPFQAPFQQCVPVYLVLPCEVMHPKYLEPQHH